MYLKAIASWWGRLLCSIGWHQKTYPAERIGWECGRCPASQVFRRGQGPGLCD